MEFFGITLESLLGELLIIELAKDVKFYNLDLISEALVYLITVCFRTFSLSFEYFIKSYLIIELYYIIF